MCLRFLCLLLLAFGGFASVIAAPGQDPVRLPTGDARPTTVADLGPREAITRSFNERWSYHVLLEDDIQLTMNLSLARLSGLREPTCGADLSVLNFGGQSYFVAREYDSRDEFAWDPARARLACKDKFFEGAPPERHRIYYRTTKDGIAYEVDLTFSEMAEGISAGDGVFTLGSESIGMYIHIPFARVSGFVAVDGTRRSVRGTAYMDHTFQTTYAPRLVRSAFRIVRHDTGGWEVGYYLLPASRYDDQPVGFGVRRAAGRTTLLRPEHVEIVRTQQRLDVDVPQQIRLHFADGSDTIVTRRRDRQAFAALDELSRIERAIVRRVIGGDMVFFRGMGTVGAGEAVAYDYLIVR